MDDSFTPVLKQQAVRNVRAILRTATGDDPVLEATPDYLHEGTVLLFKTYGTPLATWLCGIEETRLFARWVKGTAVPSKWEVQGVRTAIEITEILLTRLKPREAKLWWTSPNDYIDPMLVNLPMDEILVSPETVRNAALFLLY